MGKNFRETLNEQMKDPEFRAEWEAQEPERQIRHPGHGRQDVRVIQFHIPDVHFGTPLLAFWYTPNVNLGRSLFAFCYVLC